MTSDTLLFMDNKEDFTLPSIYDPVPADDSEVPVLAVTDDLPLLPRADRTPLIDPEAWRTAQGACAAELARAAMAVGRLDELAATMGQGAISRLATMETEEFLWAGGTPVSADELARDLIDARAGTDLTVLQQGRWAVRRLKGRGEPRDVRGFLGLHRMEGRNNSLGEVWSRLQGQDFDAAAVDFLATMTGMQDLHPITRGAFARTAWTLADLSRDGDIIEGAVWSARIMASACNALPFVPLGRSGCRLLHRGGGPRDGLQDHCIAVAESAAAASRVLLRLRDWTERALAMTARIKGNSPGKIIEALMAYPHALTATIEAHAGISRDTAERLLARMQAMGLVREVTGSKRFRIWSAAA